jgi:hypothetical protein
MRLSRLGALIVLSLLLEPLPMGRGSCLLGQVSPGPLARAHAELEGTLKCTNCHGGGRTAMPGRCTNCHKDIAWLTARGRGFHASREVRDAPCASCHPDHAGREFSLIQWPDGSPERFDHRRAGWPLEQTHAKTKCDKCHTAEFRISPAARQTARASGGKWTGVERECASCHEDVHRGALAADCTECHDAGRWTVTRGFDHDSTAYALTGKHASVKCDKCHLATRLAPRRDPRGRLVPVYKPVPHESCATCHEDVHRGQFGATCSKCHSTGGWRQIDRESFDHDRTKYPLRGSHVGVACRACHQDFATPTSRKPPFQTCGGCHADVHNRTATIAGRTVDCDQCHAVRGFSPSTYTVEQHRNTKYALEGKHGTVRCAACHRKDTTPAGATKWGNARVVIRPIFGKCMDCHNDDHGGQLTASTGKGECADCHRVLGWMPSSFDRIAHGKLRLPLDGRHAVVECRACHGADRTGLAPLPATPLGKAKFLFRVTELACSACHVDPHKGRFAAGGARAKDKGCLACHDTRTFRPSTAGVAAHAGFGYALEGAHRAAACTSCHAEMKTPVPARRSSLVAARGTFALLSFEGTKRECEACHRTPHGAQFDARPDRGRCDACHGVDAFQPASRFDHDRHASFPLRGGHERVPCSQCHRPDPRSANPRSPIYRPVSGKCESCHDTEAK